jgi:hypothetical protein
VESLQCRLHSLDRRYIECEERLKMLAHCARKYVNEGRFLIDFRDEIVLRGQHFQPFFTFDVSTIKAVQPALEVTFHGNPTPQEVKWAKTRFDQVKTACRNLWNPEYDKTSKKREAGGDSGTYDDADLIIKCIQDAIESRVEGNFIMRSESS